MAIGDELDRLLSASSLARRDWEVFEKILGIALPDANHERREMASKEIRHSYGHTVRNILRAWYEPDYEEIVRATAKKLNVDINERDGNFSIDSQGVCLTANDQEQELGIVTLIEDKILRTVTALAKADIIRQRGQDAWDKMSADAQAQFDAVMESSVTSADKSGFLSSVFAIPFVLYCIPPVGYPLSIWAISDIGDTNWKKVIPLVIAIATYRRKFNLI